MMQIHRAEPLYLLLRLVVYTQIRESIGMLPAETGGMLGGNRETGEVTHFCFDANSRKQTSVGYTPNNAYLNQVIKTEWKPAGIDYLGSIHSHPPYYPHPSPGDGVYAKRILDALDLPYLLVPIVTTIPDTGFFSLFPHIAVREGDAVRFLEQELSIGGRQQPVAKLEERGLPVPEAVPWEALAIISGIGIAATGIAIAWQLSTHNRERRRSHDRSY